MKLKHKTDVATTEIGQPPLREPESLYAVITDSAAARPVECAADLQQGGLPRPTRPDDSHNLTVRHLQTHAPKHLQIAVTLPDIIEPYHSQPI